MYEIIIAIDPDFSVAKKNQWSAQKHGEFHVLINLKCHSYFSIPSQNKHFPMHIFFIQSWNVRNKKPI